MREQATALLHAFARSDLAVISRLCAPDVLLLGTDEDERWEGRDTVLAAFAGAFDLEVAWVGEPTVRDDWVFGDVRFGDQPARVTMVFRDGRLAHAHYSVAA
jgi:ketosteroid isomerase-like protein